MEKVSGIGGVFFRANNPKELAEWYEKHLGVNPVPSGYDKLPWMQEEGPTVFAPFERNTEYFGKETQNWMINFRVQDLSKVVGSCVATMGTNCVPGLTEDDSTTVGYSHRYGAGTEPCACWEYVDCA